MDIAYRLDWITVLLALLALQGNPATLTAQLSVSSVSRIAAGPGARDRPSVVVGPNSFAIFWEEVAPFRPDSSPGPTSRILRQEVAFDGTLLGTPVVAVDAWQHQWGATATAGLGRSWLAYYFVDSAMATGDRDIALVSHSGFYEPLGGTLRVTHDAFGEAPLDQASPALLLDPASRKLAMASSTGTFLGTGRRSGSAFDSVNVEIRVMDLDGAVERRFLVRGPDFVGESVTPSLAILPSSWRERYILAYVSNAAHRTKGAAGYSVYLELFNREWRVVGGRHLSHPTGGAAEPSLASVAGKLYLAWVDNATSDIVISEHDENLHPVWPARLRAALAEAGFAEQFGAGAPGLSAPTLVNAFDQLWMVFLATWEADPETNLPRQEVFMARVAYR
jgi:hypothetical protein